MAASNDAGTSRKETAAIGGGLEGPAAISELKASSATHTDASAPCESAASTEPEPSVEHSDDPPEWPIPWTFPWVTTLVTVVCVLIWVALSQEAYPESNAALMKWGWLDAGTVWDGHWWSLVAASFVHGDLEHLMGNLVVFWIFAWRLEQVMGHARFLLFVLLSCFVSAAVEQGWSGIHSFGASGVASATFGLFAATWFRVRFLPAWIFFPVCLIELWVSVRADLSDVLSEAELGVALGEVAFVAHLSGFAFGVLTGAVSFHRWPRWIPISAISAAVIASALLLLLPSRNYQWLLHQAERAGRRGDREMAMRWLDEATSRRPDLPNAAGMRASYLIDESRFEEARSAATWAVALEERLISNARSALMRNAEDSEEAEEIRETQFSFVTGFQRTISGLVDLQLAEYVKAELEFDRAIAQSPDFELAFALRGRASLEQSRHDDAIDDLNEAILINPHDPLARAMRGIAFHERAELLAARIDFEEAYQLLRSDNGDPTDIEGLHSLATIYAAEAQWEEAAAVLRKLMAKAPRRAESASLLAFVLCQSSEHATARELAEQSLSWNKRSAYGWYVKGIALNGLGQPVEALRAFSHSIELNPRSAATLVGRGIALRRQGKLDESMADLNRALELNDRYAPAYAARAETWTALKRPGKANADRQTAITLDPSADLGNTMETDPVD